MISYENTLRVKKSKAVEIVKKIGLTRQWEILENSQFEERFRWNNLSFSGFNEKNQSKNLLEKS